VDGALVIILFQVFFLQQTIMLTFSISIKSSIHYDLIPDLPDLISLKINSC